MERIFPINPFYAPEHPPIDRLRCRVDYEVYQGSYAVSPDGWHGPEWWQYKPGDDERFGFSVDDLPRLFAIWIVFEAVTGMAEHYISGDTDLIEGTFKALPWLNPNVISDSDFSRFAELMDADERKARGFFRKALSHAQDEADDDGFAEYDDPDIPF